MRKHPMVRLSADSDPASAPVGCGIPSLAMLCLKNVNKKILSSARNQSRKSIQTSNDISNITLLKYSQVPYYIIHLGKPLYKDLKKLIIVPHMPYTVMPIYSQTTPVSCHTEDQNSLDKMVSIFLVVGSSSIYIWS